MNTYIAISSKHGNAADEQDPNHTTLTITKYDENESSVLIRYVDIKTNILRMNSIL
jgi:hypothetical protein